MRVALEHAKLLVPANGRDLCDVEALFEQTADAFVPADRGSGNRPFCSDTKMLESRDEPSYGVTGKTRSASRPLSALNSLSIATARRDSGMSRESPFLVRGRCATQRTRSTCCHCRSSISPRRIAVSIARMIRGFISGVRPLSHAESRRASSPAFRRRVRPRGTCGRLTSFTGLRGNQRPHSRVAISIAWLTRVELSDDCRWGDTLQALVSIGRDVSACQLGERPVRHGAAQY